MQNLRRAVAGLAAVTAVALGTPAICADAPAPSAHSAELAKRLFNDMHMDRMMDQMVKSMIPTVIAQARKNNPSMSDDDAKVVSEAVTESTAEMMAKVVDRMAPLYASTFSEKELQDLVNFYEGPSGQAMLAKMPLLMSKMGPMMSELMPEMSSDVTRRICSKIDCTKHAAPPAPKG